MKPPEVADGVHRLGTACANFYLRLHRFDEDRARALASRDRLATLGAEALLFGHGDPWRDGLAQALDVAGATDDHPERAPRTP
jgi:hypothetical protein